MIECTSEYIYKKKRKVKGKKLIAFFLTLIIALGVVLYYKYFISSELYKLSFSYAYSYCTESVNDAIIDSLNDKIKYSDLIKIEKNNAGDIVLITANSYKVNLISREITQLSANNVKNKLSGGVPVPSLAFTGIGLIAGLGVKINIKMLNVSSVYCDFDSSFMSVGINQTLHKIYAKITSEVKINVPLNERTEIFETSVLLTEAVLVGEVPDVYLNGKIFG